MPRTTSGFASKPLTGENHPRWKGGRIIRMGYECIRMPSHPNNQNGYVFVHRLIAEQKLGRYLLPDERAHHINGDRLDNRPENISIISDRQHGIEHHKPIYEELRDREWLAEKTKTMGCPAIAKLLGCNPRLVYDFQQFYGIKSSHKGGRPKKVKGF